MCEKEGFKLKDSRVFTQGEQKDGIPTSFVWPGEEVGWGEVGAQLAEREMAKQHLSGASG